MRSSSLEPIAEPKLSLRGHALWPAVALAAGAATLEATALDRRVADFFFDPDARRWRWGGSFWSNELIHRGGRDLVAAVGFAALGIVIASLVVPRLRAVRRTAGFVLLSIGLATGTVALLKRVTNVDCPRDLVPYGGNRPYVRLFEDRPDRLPAAACFPGGHSSGGFALLCFYFVLRELAPNTTKRLHGLAGALAIGSLFALGQWARGAHFVSHDLWSAAIAWYTALALYTLPFGARLRR